MLIEKLLTFIDNENVTEQFSFIADNILNYFILSVDCYQYRICEIEFYINSFFHKDPFVHCDIEQTNFGHWYFHRQNGHSYKGGTFKGLDIVIGDKSRYPVYGGILIRSILDIKKNRLIEGPCNCVNEILKKLQCSNISELTENKQLNLFNGNKLKLIFNRNVAKQKIIKLKRIGLNARDNIDKMHYINKCYRFLIFPDRIKKETSNWNKIISSETINLPTRISIRKTNLIKIGYTDLEKWLEDKNNTYIGRAFDFYVKGAIGSKWQNPFQVHKYGLHGCLKKFLAFLINNPDLLKQIEELKYKNVGCWCESNQLCHGDILISLIN